MRRPPDCVAEIARYHWLMGGTVLFFVGLIYFLTRDSRYIEFGRQTYVIAIGLGVLYVTAGTLVWLGLPGGRPLNYICCLPYLTRPRLGSHLWEQRQRPEFQAHFRPQGPQHKV